MPALVLASAILLVLGVLAYRRALIGQVTSTKDKGQSKSRKAEVADIGLLALRLVILLLFAAVFIGAVFTHVWTERLRRVAVMLDVSESMSAVGAESAAAAIAAAFPLPAEATRQEWVFADSAEVRSQKSEARSQSADRTRIGAGLKTVGKTRPGAVVLLSDGQDNDDVDPLAAARDIGVPVYTVGFGGLARRNASVEQVMLPAVVYSGDTVDVQVRVGAAGFADERGRVRLRGAAKEIVLGQAMAEQDVPFRLVFDRPGRQVIEVRLDSLNGESNYADNTRSVTVDVRPGRVRVAYVTNRPGPDFRMMQRALASDERIEVATDVAVTGGMSGTKNSARVDVYILDNVVETGSPEVWRTIADGVRAGAGALVLAGPDFQPGQSVGKVLNGTVGRAQTGTFTPELTAEGGVLPWFDGDAIDIARVPPFVGLRPLAGLGHDPNLRTNSVMSRHQVWLVAQENKAPLMVAGKTGKGKVVYVAGYPLWRWGFGPEVKPEQGSQLSIFVTGVVRYLAERDTSPFWLQADRRELYRGQPVRLTMRAVAPDGRPWSGLSVMVAVQADSAAPRPSPQRGEGERSEGEEAAHGPIMKQLSVPMTETGMGVYEVTLEALGPGRYRASATAGLADKALGSATTEFAVAEQAIELANTGLNEGLLRAIAEASGGRFFRSDSLVREGAGITLGSYQRRFMFDPRRAVWAYVLIALLAGAEWLLRRRRGML